MGVVISKVSRKIKRFNVENRAHKLLDQDAIRPAPKFEESYKDLERTLEVDPKYLEKLNKRDSGLENRLKEVYVTSEDSYMDYRTGKSSSEKPLPLSRELVGEFEFGFMEPDRVSPGRCTLRQAMQFINDHQQNPTEWNKDKIAMEYSLKLDIVDKILLHFRTYELFVPDKYKRERILTQTTSKLLDDKDESEKRNR